ncbi:MAG TPA: hypothetical protein VIF62_13450, partial [Labilithrix sp.]
MRALAAVFALGLVACGGAAPSPSAPGEKPMKPTTMEPMPASMDDLAKKLVTLFNAHDGQGVVALFADSMARNLPVEKTGP